MIRKALIQARLSMGLSQEKVAERIGVTRNTISQWERGVQNPYPIYVYALCKLFGKSAQELALDARWRELDQREMNDETQKAQAALPLSLSEQTTIQEQLNTPIMATDVDISLRNAFFSFPDIIHPSKTLAEAVPYPARRQILHHLLMIGSTALVLSPYSMLRPDKNDPPKQFIIEELETITASYWRLSANTSLDLLGNISEHFRVVVDLLQRTPPQRTAQRLCSLSGEIAQILGQTLFDLQEHSLAWSYYIFSLKAAQAASNHDLWAVGIGRMILLLIARKNLQEALPLLHEAHQLKVQNGRILCWLAAIEAEIHAHLGNVDACENALKVAREIVQQEALGEDLYVTRFNASRLAGYEGACFIRLRQPDRALPALERALSLLDPKALRSQSRLLADLGVAYAQQGEILKACQLADKALSLTAQIKSRAVLERIRTVRSELDTWKETSAVQDLERQIDRTHALILV